MAPIWGLILEPLNRKGELMAVESMTKDKSNASNAQVELEDDLMLEDYLGDESIDIDLEDVDYFDSWCPECKATKAHASLKDGTHRIICAECNHKHLRDDESKINVAPISKGLLSQDDFESEETLRLAWIRLIKDLKKETVQKYSIKSHYKSADVIEHSKYGLGVVCEILENGKLNILFEDKMRKLVCGK